jgi:putative membrane protein
LTTVILKLVKQTKNNQLEINDSQPSAKKLFGIGLSMGAADLVPGVSGGTIAFIFGIYENLLEAIKTLTSTTLRYLYRFNLKAAWNSVPFTFIIPVLAGISVAILSLSNAVTFLLDTYPTMLWSVFFGLVFASIFIVHKRVVSWSLSRFTSLLIGMSVTFFIAGFSATVTEPHAIVLFGTGFIAFSAMILPGISGSLIMVLLGMYEYVIRAISNFDVVSLTFVALGGIFGLAILSRLISWSLKNYHDITVAFLIGLMMGSLRRIWPWKEPLQVNDASEAYLQANVLPQLTTDFGVNVCLILLAIVFVVVLERRTHKERDTSPRV